MVPTLDDTIYVARPELIELDEDKVAFEELDDALAAEAKTASAIRILGGYYNKDALIALCLRVPARPQSRRRDCTVEIVVGGEGFGSLPRTWAELRAVGTTLKNEGFGTVDVRLLLQNGSHFHTKLYGFRQGSQAVWFVGSANPGSKRHELMVRVDGHHKALNDYAKAAIRKATPVMDGAPPLVEARTLQDFFMAGFLCHRPSTQHLFTFDAFRFSKADRDKLGKALGETGQVAYASPKTEGYGFSLASAMQLETPQTGDGQAKRKPAVKRPQRIRTRDSGIYTVLGLWMPATYANKLEKAFANERAARKKRLMAFSKTLEGAAGSITATNAFDEHLRSMKNFLKENRIGVQPVRDPKKAFDRFFRSRRALLADEESRVRLSQMVTLQEMPDIWADQRAAKAFEDSFFEDLAYRAGPLVGNRGRLVNSLVEGLLRHGSPETDDEFRRALVKRLKVRAWKEDDWL